MGLEARPEPLPPGELGSPGRGAALAPLPVELRGAPGGVLLAEDAVLPELLLPGDGDGRGSPPGLPLRSCWLACESWSAACRAAAGSPEAAADWALRAAWTACAAEELEPPALPEELAFPDWPSGEAPLWPGEPDSPEDGPDFPLVA